MRVAIFAYGTLMVPAVMDAVCGDRYRHADATLAGFARFVVHGTTYPAIVPCEGATTDGRVYFDVCSGSLARLDAYEDGMYERTSVHVEARGVSLSALTYVIAERFVHEVSMRSWSLQRFCDEHLDSLLCELRRAGCGA